MGIINEFKAFAVKGNVIDLAVAVIIGGAFGQIVSSFVADIIMPPIGLLLGGVDFTDLKWVLKDAYIDPDGTEIGAVSVNYGTFIQTVVDFLIIAAAIFMAIKGLNSLKKKEAAAPTAPPAPTKEQVLLTEIRDILKDQQRGNMI
jgi:large conductance mechanosensitive channel